MFEGLKRSIGRSLLRATTPMNAYNQAFFGLMGGLTARYDNADGTYIEKGFNLNADVYSIITQMANKCSDIPAYIKKVKDEKSLESYRRLRKSTAFNQIIKKAEHQYKALEGEEVPFPLERPNPEQTWGEFVALSVVFFKLTGNCYWYEVTPSEREGASPLAMYILPSHLMSIVLKKNADLQGIESPIDYYLLREGTQAIRFASENVIHIKNPNPNFDLNGSHLYGISDLRAALGNIESSNEAINNNIKSMKNGGAFGFIHSKGNTPMTAEQAKEIKNRLVEMDSSPERLSKIGGISAEMGFTRIALTTDELKPFDYLNYDQKQICNVLGWSVELLNNREGASGINNGSMETELKRVVINTCLPILNKFEEALNSRFLPKFKSTQGAVIEFDHTELPEMQDDMEKLTQWLYDGLDRGVFTRKMVLQALKYPVDDTDPNMDVRTVSMNIMSLDDALMPLEGDLTVDE